MKPLKMLFRCFCLEKIRLKSFVLFKFSADTKFKWKPTSRRKLNYFWVVFHINHRIQNIGLKLFRVCLTYQTNDKDQSNGLLYQMTYVQTKVSSFSSIILQDMICTTRQYNGTISCNARDLMELWSPRFEFVL